MAPVKKRPPARSHHKSKPRRRKPNIPELVYKFLSLENSEVGGSARHTCHEKCPFCKRQKRRDEVLSSLDSQSTDGRNMANTRKSTGRNSKIHRARRRQTFKNQTFPACVRKCSGSEGLKKMKKYIQKALNFGVESGYLIPKGATYKVLRVSSDLMSDGNYASKARSPGRTVSRDRDRSPRQTPIRFEDYEVQDASRRRRRGSRRRRSRRKRRSRSGSTRRTRSRRGSRSGNADEVVENEIDYEFSENQDDKRDNPETADGDEGNERLNQSDGEKTTAKRGEDGSDVSVDEDESDEEEEKKRNDTTKS